MYIRELNGRKRIEIPLFPQEVTKENLESYLPTIMTAHIKNLEDIKYLKNYYKGLQPITAKLKEEGANSVVVENHAYAIVDFKTGYNFGEPIKYAVSNEAVSTDDISELDKYMRCLNKETLDSEMGEELYTCGVARRIILPSVEANAKTPFDIYNLKSENSEVVYSSSIENMPLFGIVITPKHFTNVDVPEYDLTIYTEKEVYTYEYSTMPIFKAVEPHFMQRVPFVEYKINSAYLSPIEVVHTLLNAVNSLESYSVDNVIDFVNSYLVFYNVAQIDKEDKEAMDSTKSITLQTNDPNRPADVKYLINAMQHGDVNVVYENLVKVAYDIVGVPRTSTTITSGGDTGSARLLGGGWTKAEQIAKKEEKFLKRAERELLDICLSIANVNPNAKINELESSDIEITFNRTRHDNLQSRIQALAQLHEMKMPNEAALNIVGVVADTHEVAMAWEINEKNILEQETMNITFEEPNEDTHTHEEE